MSAPTSLLELLTAREQEVFPRLGELFGILVSRVGAMWRLVVVTRVIKEAGCEA